METAPEIVPEPPRLEPAKAVRTPKTAPLTLSTPSRRLTPLATVMLELEAIRSVPAPVFSRIPGAVSAELSMTPTEPTAVRISKVAAGSVRLMAPAKVWVPPLPSVRSLELAVMVSVPVRTEEPTVPREPSSSAPTEFSPTPATVKFWA